MSPDLSDRALAACAAAGDQEAWDVLVERYAQLVWDKVRGHGLDSLLAAETARLTWLRFADRLDERVAGGVVRDWLCAVADHQSLVARRRPDRDPDASGVAPTGTARPVPVAGGAAPAAADLAPIPRGTEGLVAL